ncbi:MAG: hypothetical protein JNM78_10930 [Cyclobacteriaceae bacterium]|jgi:hypothetical protein|nr:hypothetical protein [Cyclobacteriaceae bacterium]
MKIKVKYADALLDAVCEKTGLTKDYPGLKAIATQIDRSFKEDYLYKSFLDRIKKKNPTDLIGLGINQLNILSNYLGYKNFNEFVLFVDHPIDSQLLSCVGTYYSYVRRNTEESALLKSPVRISVSDRKVIFELRGPKWTYVGEMHLANGCLFILMRAKGGKTFYHVYKIGTRESPEVLQGTFAGASTAFDPIGGTTVLAKCEEEYSKMRPEEVLVKNVIRTGSQLEKRLSLYFKRKDGNNLNPIRAITFTVEDL